MRAIVHIGMPKTGTTSIQTWLDINRAALAGRGIAYDRIALESAPAQPPSQLEVGLCGLTEAGLLVNNPEVRRTYGLGSFEDQAAFCAEFEPRFARAVREAEAAGAETFVVSSEHIEAWTEKEAEVAGLDRFLGTYFSDVTYLVYIRRQEDWLLSYYTQALRRGDGVTLAEYVERWQACGFADRLDLWARVVGRDRLSVRLMERDALTGGDLVEDFARALGTRSAALRRPWRRNAAMSAIAAEFLRLMNRATPPLVDEGRRRNPLVKGVATRLTALSARGPKLALSPEQAQAIRDANAADNARIRDAFFPGRPALFADRPLPDGPAPEPTPTEMGWIGLEMLFAARLGELPPLSEEEVAAVHAARKAVAEARRQHEMQTS